MTMARSMVGRNSLESCERRQALRALTRRNGGGNRLRGAAQDAIANALGSGVGAGILGYLIKSLYRLINAKVDGYFVVVAPPPQAHFVAGLLREDPAFRIARRLRTIPAKD